MIHGIIAWFVNQTTTVLN